MLGEPAHAALSTMVRGVHCQGTCVPLDTVFNVLQLEELRVTCEVRQTTMYLLAINLL